MATLNYNSIEGIVEVLPKIKDKIEETSNELNNYLEVFKDEKFEENENERDDEAIKRAEDIHDRLGEMRRRNQIVLNHGKETIELISNMKDKIENVVDNCESDGIRLTKTNIWLIDKIIEIEERKMNKEVETLQKQIELAKQRFSNKKNEWDNQKLSCEEYKRMEEERMKNIKNKREEEERRIREGLERKIIEEERKRGMEERRELEKKRSSREEIKQIEEWTKMKVGNIIFDSDINDWNVNTSEFDEKIINKSNLLFLIEDEDGNKFGGYVNAKINQVGVWMSDSKSFVFSLKSNGGLNGMLKFDAQRFSSAFGVYPKSSTKKLFAFGNGNDICVFKEYLKNESKCYQDSFQYNGIQNALCGKKFFTPKRITVVQMG